jgi:hypothetical protein
MGRVSARMPRWQVPVAEKKFFIDWGRVIFMECSATSKNYFEQSARAVALTVCPHTQVQLSLSSFTPTFCNVPLPELMVHCPDTTCSERSLQCASQMVF